MKCGIIMPISEIDGCSAEHWKDVLTIFRDALESTEFEPLLVSDASETGVIQKRIVENIYNNEIVICDVSGKNPNVMFELGMRLAFDKPTVVVKDDQTSYSFDTSVIEHLSYPRELRHGQIEEFKKELAEKVNNTYEKSASDSTYSTFLKHFGSFTVATLPQEQLPENQFIVRALEKITSDVEELKSNSTDPMKMINNILESYKGDTACVRGSESSVDSFVDNLGKDSSFETVSKSKVASNHYHVSIGPDAKSNEAKIRELAAQNDLRVSWIR